MLSCLPNHYFFVSYEYKVQIFHDFYRSPCSGRDGVAT